MKNANETLLDWLRDAHAMEDSIIEILEKQAKGLNDRPDIQSKVKEHLEVTREQRDRLKVVIEKLGGSTSTMKVAAGNFLATVAAIAGAGAADAVVKNSLANFAIEHFEIASYLSLIAAAEAQGQQEVKRVCQQNLDEEQEMANWLEHHIPRITNDYLGRVETARR